MGRITLKGRKKGPHPYSSIRHKQNRTRCLSDQFGCPYDFGGFGWLHFSSALRRFPLQNVRRIWGREGQRGSMEKEMPSNEYRVRFRDSLVYMT